eukprot:1337737-Pleurochrysis_carterae.AAC.6
MVIWCMQCKGAAMASLGCMRAASLAAAFTTARRAGSRSKADHREGGRMFARVAGGIGLGVLVLGMEDIGKTDVMQSKSAAMCHSELPTTRTVEVVSVQNHTKDVNPLNSTSKRRMRVLITGFHDWRHEEDTLDAPNEENDEKKNTTDVENTRSVQNVQRTLWRCKDNPSCRLLYGAACATPPIERSGPLVRALADEELEADFVFQSLPVIWNTSFGLDLLAFDVVVHMGLGVYDSDSTLMLESGAFNCRRGTDVIGAERAEHIDGLDGQAAVSISTNRQLVHTRVGGASEGPRDEFAAMALSLRSSLPLFLPPP